MYLGDTGHLPFARLKLKPVNRMSCIIDYDSSTLERKKNGLGKLASRAGLSVTGGHQGAQGGKCQMTGVNKTLGQCFVCLEAATMQVRTIQHYHVTSATAFLYSLNCFSAPGVERRRFVARLTWPSTDQTPSVCPSRCPTLAARAEVWWPQGPSGPGRQS